MNQLISTEKKWPTFLLGKLCLGENSSIQTGPFGSQLHASDYVMHRIPCIMPQDIINGRISTAAIARISETDHQRLTRYHLQVGDIVYPRRGDVTKCALVQEAEHGWLCGTGCLRIRPNNDSVNSAWLSYYLSHPEVRDWLISNAVGATMPHLNTGIVSSIPVLLPPLNEQNQIAAILKTLDDKIELNRKTSATLEAMA